MECLINYCFVQKKEKKGLKENARQRKAKSSSNVTADKRLLNFRKRIQYGPIFVCSSCHQKLFENQVEHITEEIRNMIDNADPGIRAESMEEEIIMDLGINADDSKIEFSFLCKSCKWYLIRGKRPKFCTKNGLIIDVIDEKLKLSE